jgi:hypothetical protein
MEVRGVSSSYWRQCTIGINDGKAKKITINEMATVDTYTINTAVRELKYSV